jgi:TetR/AcrR family transcriptional regulator, regulator of mycofactocin system
MANPADPERVRPMSLRERNRARTYTDIADAALGLFETYGYDSTTVEQIATTAGVSPATFFRYFATKEDVLFADEDASAVSMLELVAGRTDRGASIAALAEPVLAYAESMIGPGSPNSRRLTRLVMTTPSLEARSLRMRLRWERDIARLLADEAGLTTPTLAHTMISAVAVSCLTSAYRHWSREESAEALLRLVREAFDVVADV